MASLTPAERSGIAQEVGSLAVGKHADVLVLSKRLRIKRVVIRGQLLPTKPASAHPS
jgi:N-acetylglucosamine-6-phosphate deacetylase